MIDGVEFLRKGMAPAFLLAPVLLLACGRGPEEAAAGAASAPAGPRWNVVLISLDTTRADRLGFAGSERPTSPHLDALAAEARVFSDCLATSSLTDPSHRSLFTSHHVRRHGILRNGWPSRDPYTMAGLLRAAGWRTAGFVAGGPLDRKFGFAEGFDTWEQAVEGVRNAHLGRIGIAVDGARRWLETAGREPFFLFVHGFDPHCPYTPPPETRGTWSDWYQGPLDPAGRCGQDGFGEWLDQGGLGPEEQRYLQDLYDEEILAADTAIGALLDDLRERGLLERSVVVFLSDHGESLGEHNWVGHARMWHEELWVPLLIRFPGGRWAGRDDSPVQLVDVLPTLFSFLGVPAPPGVQGLDLMPWIRGEAAAPPGERLRLSRAGNHVAVQLGRRWKVAFRWDGPHMAFRHLYDLETDPGETVDLFPTAEGRRRTREILERFQSWTEAQAAGDERWRTRRLKEELSAEDRAGLEALGYVEGDEEEQR